MATSLIFERMHTYFLFPFALDKEAIEADLSTGLARQDTLGRWFGFLDRGRERAPCIRGNCRARTMEAIELVEV